MHVTTTPLINIVYTEIHPRNEIGRGDFCKYSNWRGKFSQGGGSRENMAQGKCKEEEFMLREGKKETNRLVRVKKERKKKNFFPWENIRRN